MLVKSMMEAKGTNQRTYRKLASKTAKYELAVAIAGMIIVSSLAIDSALYGLLNTRQVMILAIYALFTNELLKRDIAFVRIENLNIHGKKYIKITESRGKNEQASFCVSGQRNLPVGRKGKTVYVAANTKEFVGDESGEYAITFDLGLAANRFLNDLKKRYYECAK